MHRDDKQINKAETIFTFAVMQEYITHSFKYDEESGIYLAECPMSGFIVGRFDKEENKDSTSGYYYMPDNGFRLLFYNDLHEATKVYDNTINWYYNRGKKK